MAGPYYVRTADGSDASDGLSWANAFATITQFAAVDAAGETCYVADDYSHNLTVDTTWAFAGTLSNPTRIICVDDTGDPEPPTALATGPGITSGSGIDLTITGSAYIYGMVFTIGTSSTAASLRFHPTGSDKQIIENCQLILSGAHNSSQIRAGAGDNGQEVVEFIDCDIKFSATNEEIAIGCDVAIRGGGVMSGGSTPSALYYLAVGSTAHGARLRVDGFDYSNFASTFDFIAVGSDNKLCIAKINACKLPTSWSGALFSAAPTSPVEAELIASGDYKYRKEANTGTIIDENTIKPTTTNAPFTLEMATNSTPVFPFNGLRSPWFSVNNTTTGSSVTVSIEFVHDSVTNLQDDEIGIEVEGLATSGSTISTLYRSEAGILDTPADCTDSSEAWTTTGLTNPNTQKLTVTFTPQVAGLIKARVVLYKPSYTVFVEGDARIA